MEEAKNESRASAEVVPQGQRMLEIRNVTKVYKTKGGVETKALDDVSITFPETGLVFLLGKSGSGKSTLLNISGGLDEPTSGEVVVKGKSSKDFSGADFDSYRNTFIGFIFQEYNILDEFNVEDNIALALELQGKSKDREKINALLDEVDLKDFARRKPNTLSGGQKQRIAIARALVKDPQIIMADEPTGALDSATGKQVFDTLKKLSRTRLVMVVSHDREFAEIYGDRIVELKDGKIISDETKRSVPPKAVDDNVSLVGEDTLTIKSGTKLTKTNVAEIEKFISAADGDVILTRGGKEITAFRKATRMSEDNKTETFTGTEEADIPGKEYTKEDARFIRSRLPAGKAIKIGASGLKLKPIRLIFTVLLSVVAFIMFGLFSTLMLYDGNAVAASSFAHSDIKYLDISKKYSTLYTYSDGDTYLDEYGTQAAFTPEDIEKLASDLSAPVYGYYLSQNDAYNTDVAGSAFANVSASNSNGYYNPCVKKFAVVSQNEESSLTKIAGEFPRQADEIMLSSYVAKSICTSPWTLYGLTGESNDVGTAPIAVNNPADLVGKKLLFGESGYGDRIVFTVSGIFDSGEIDGKYSSLNSDTAGPATQETQELKKSYSAYLYDSMHAVAFISPETYKAHQNVFYKPYFSIQVFDYLDGSANILSEDPILDLFGPTGDDGKYTADDIKERQSEGSSYVEGVVALSQDNAEIFETFFFDGPTKTTLTGNQVLISANSFSNAFGNVLASRYLASIRDSITSYTSTDPKIEEYNSLCQLGNEISWIGDRDDTEKDALLERLGAALDETNTSSLPGKINMNGSDQTIEVVGIYYGDSSNNGLFVSEGLYGTLPLQENYGSSVTHYKPESGAQFMGAIVGYDGTESTFKKLLAFVGVNNRTEKDVFLDINNSLYQSFRTVNNMLANMSKVFMIIGIVFAVFSALLLFNFISMSISNKRKEIGILRAVGARGSDVFKIFFAESGIIVGICLIISLIGTIVVCNLINRAMIKALGMAITLFVFGWLSAVIMAALAVVIAFVATFYPVFMAARKKPVDSIRSL